MIKNKILRRSLKVFVALVVLLILLPFSLYIPWVQNVAKDYACDYASEATGLDIKLDRILLKFPLDLSIDGLSVVEENGDTMARVENFVAGVEFMPLLDLNFKIGDATLKNGYYHMLSADGATVLGAQVDYCKLLGTDVDMNNHVLNLLDGELNGGEITFTSYPHKAVEEPDTAASTPWRINAYHLALSDIDVTMRMLPTIDKLHAYIGKAELVNGVIDTGEHTVDALTLAVDSADVRYYTLSQRDAELYSQLHPVPVDTTWSPSDTITWRVKGDSIRLTRSHVLYAQRSVSPAAGLDPDYLELSDVNVMLRNLYNRASTVSVDVDHISGKERCGLEVESANGSIYLDENKIDVNKFRLKTFLSTFYIDAHAPFTLLNDKPTGNFFIETDNKIALQEISMLSPALRATLKQVPQYNPLALKGKIQGTPEHIDIKSFTATIPRYLDAKVNGVVNHPLDMNRLSGDLTFDADFPNLNFVKPLALDAATSKQVNFPPMTVKGHAKFGGNAYSGNVDMRLATGSFVGKGSFNGNGNRYDVDANFSNFPIRAIMPLAPVDNLTAHVKADGHGFDFLKPSTAVNADVNLGAITYEGTTYRDITANVHMNAGDVTARVNSNNPHCSLFVDAQGKIQGERYIFNVNGNIRDLDTQALGFTDFPLNGTGDIVAFVDFDMATKDCVFDADLSHMNWNYDGAQLTSENTDLRLVSNNNTIEAFIDNEETHLDFKAQCNIDDFMKHLDESLAEVNRQMDARALDVSALQAKLPKFSLKMKVGPSGLVPRYLGHYDIDVRDFECEIKNDSILNLDGYIHQLSIGTNAIDTITIHAHELTNKYLRFDLHMGNRPGTWDDFAQVDIRGGAKDSIVDFLVEQRNIKKEMGYRLGANVTLSGENIKTRLFPTHPIIAYRDWEVNENNHIDFNYNTMLLDADLTLKSAESSLALRTEPTLDPGKENIFLTISNLKLEEWLGGIPTLPDVSGTVDADMKMLYDGKNFDGNGDLLIRQLCYEGQYVGDMKLNTDLAFDPATGSTRLNGEMAIDGSKVALAYGVLNDSTAASPMDVAVKLERFPMQKASAFIPGGYLTLGGYLNGEVKVKGSMDEPEIHGFVKGDSAVVELPTYGCKLRLSDDVIPIDDGIITFNNYSIYGLNNNAAKMNGMVDINTMDMDLRISGKNIQVIGAEQQSYSEVFGKGYADISATVRSKNNAMDIDAKVTMLTGSNITYVMQEDVSTLTTSQVDKEMVKFVSQSDSTGVSPLLTTQVAHSSSDIDIDIEIQPGVKINAFLSPDGKDRAVIEGSGRLRYSLDFAGKDNMVGVYTIESGNVRYSPPVISQKIFDINSGSSVTWNGDVLNPQLNITGVQTTRASVTGSDGKSKLLNFQITAMIRNTLKKLDLAFDISTDDDMTVKNEIQGMTDVQRSNAAMNMLLYNTYSGTNSSGNINLSTTGALYSFIQSQLNSWAASTLKGVDLTFGINQFGNEGNGNSMQTSYSYRLAKTLFNDRFKIVVGGEYSTAATSEQNLSNNLISDISLEYLLNNSGSRYLRLFRHTGWESVLEGEVTEMGVGFVMKRKAPTLKLLFRNPKPRVQVVDTVATAAPDTTEVNDK
ncbi:MAG: translocation/assembly module TamB domain-containing protein [Bacteroidales bacterium]|nr:translocation/assembly module TamB domain-containing protein [Bacteroidales bacterium]